MNMNNLDAVAKKSKKISNDTLLGLFIENNKIVTASNSSLFLIDESTLEIN